MFCRFSTSYMLFRKVFIQNLLHIIIHFSINFFQNNFITWTCKCIFSFFFSVYIKYFNGFSTYGSLTTIIIILLWMYFCFYIMMIGAFLNRYFAPAYQVIFFKNRKTKAKKREQREEMASSAR